MDTPAEIGIESASRATINRLPAYATTKFRDWLTRAHAQHAGISPGTLVLYDVTTLFFETETDEPLSSLGPTPGK